jgi:glycerol-1-phosphate dehydrogenase [NAD(P)+]
MMKGMDMSKLGWASLGTSFDCTCGISHKLPIDVCHIGDDAAEKLAEYARDKCGTTCLVVADENTLRVAGDRVHRALAAAGKKVIEKIYGPEPLEATDKLGDEVAEAGANADFFVAIGSGTLCDLAKYAGDKLKRPALLYATAASMNGYTSAIVAVKVRGLKRTLPCAPAVGVFASPAVVATAPTRMTAAGVADFLSKAASSSDWCAANFLRGDYYCQRPREFYEGIQERVLEAAPRVPSGDPEAIHIVTEGLLLSGLSMVVAGSSAPASGGEHLLSHFLDMKHALIGTPADLHGAQVGVGTVYCLGLWEKALALDPAKMDIEAMVAGQPSAGQIEAWIEEDWGSVAPEVHAQWAQKNLSPDALRAELRKFQSGLDHLREALSHDLLPSSVVRDAIAASGGPVEPEEMDASVEEYRKAQTRARYIRNRFTVLDLAAELCIQ